MLPDIAAKDWLRASHERVFAIWRLGDDQTAVLYSEPCPTRTKLRDTGLDEIFTHFVIAAVGVEKRFNFAWDTLAAAVGLHPIPEMKVVVMLTGLIDQSLVAVSIGFLDDLGEAQVLKLCSCDQAIASGDVGVVVLVVVEL